MDLDSGGDQSARFCDMADVERACPLTVDEAQRIMQEHIGCAAVECPRKSPAYMCLVRAGRIVPPTKTPRERASARGLAYVPLPPAPMSRSVPDFRTLISVLDGLTRKDADAEALAQRLSPRSEVWRANG